MSKSDEPARKRLEVDERREQLLDLAVELFASKTYDEISIDEIAKAAGVSKGLLYHYFPSKRAFYVAAMRKAAEWMLVETDPGPYTVRRDREGMIEGFEAFLGYVDRGRKAYSSLMRGGIGVDPEVGAIIEQTRSSFVKRMLKGLGLTEEQSNHPRVKSVLAGWVGYVEGVTLHWADDPQCEIRVLAEMLTDTSIALLTEGLVPKKAKTEAQ